MASTPKIIFIVPYRDREMQRDFFRSHMKSILSDMEPSSYEIYFSHQSHSRRFNRGEMKNIGFLGMKQKYPNIYSKRDSQLIVFLKRLPKQSAGL